MNHLYKDVYYVHRNLWVCFEKQAASVAKFS